MFVKMLYEIITYTIEQYQWYFVHFVKQLNINYEDMKQLTVSFRLARNNVFCHNFVNTWNFLLKKMSFERTRGDLSQKFANFIKSTDSQTILTIFDFLMGSAIH